MRFLEQSNLCAVVIRFAICSVVGGIEENREGLGSMGYLYCIWLRATSAGKWR
jgi:hypothetical protein